MSPPYVLPVMLGWLPLAVLVVAVNGDSMADDAQPGRGANMGSLAVSPLDAYIDGRLTTAYLMSEHLSAYPIEVRVREGRVLLAGAVANRVQRDLALEIAHSVDEVREVDSAIEIKADAVPRPVRTEADSFARRVEDAGITARIKTRLLWNASTRGLAIEVNTRDHIVTLNGTVESRAEGILAQLIAANTRGVRHVMNRLRVGEGPVQADVASGGTG